MAILRRLQPIRQHYRRIPVDRASTRTCTSKSNLVPAIHVINPYLVRDLKPRACGPVMVNDL